MKKALIILIIFMSIYTLNTYAQCGGSSTNSSKPTNIGIIIYSNDAEKVWNALRLANYSIIAGDTVNIFLLGKGVDIDSYDNKNFNVKEQSETFTKGGGKILACGTCLQSRNISSPKVCSISTMSELYDMIRKSKITLTF